jgi:predicted DNA-binding transcriptional regulator YafY
VANMRADRLLSILLLLQVQRSMTSRELAARLEVSERTIHRDMEALSAAGVPVAAERGRGGGWFLLEGYRTDLTGLNEAETQAVFLAGPGRLLADLGLERAADAALIKLLAALPAFNRRDAEHVRQRIYVDIGGWQRWEEDVSTLPTLQDAIWQERRLEINYRRADGSAVTRTIEPLGLVAKGSVWYLVGAVEGELRTYRVSRIQQATLTEQPFTRPADFDLVAHWEQSSAEFTARLPRYPAVLRAAPEALRRMRGWRYARAESTSPPDAEGWVIVNMLFELEENAVEYVLGCGASIEVRQPPELRELVINAARGILTVYTGDYKPGGV